MYLIYMSPIDNCIMRVYYRMPKEQANWEILHKSGKSRKLLFVCDKRIYNIATSFFERTNTFSRLLY